MPRKNPRRNISRIEVYASQGNHHGGWEVRMQRQGKKYSKFFADGQWGGRRKALREAQQYRDELERRLKPYSVKKLAENPSIRNSSGITGVRKEVRTWENDGYEYRYEYWIAQWTDGLGRRRTRSFSIARYGEQEAFNRALAVRRQGVNQAKRTI